MSARAEALAVIGSHLRLTRLVETLASEYDDDPGHDAEHHLRVAGWTLRCGPELPPEEAVGAALLHDLVNLAKNDPLASQASEKSAERARRILLEHGFEPDSVERMARAIEDHSYSRGRVPTDPLGRALQDADRLEALGALGVFRTISCGTQMEARYFEPTDPWAKARPLDDKRYTVDHFFTKLLKLSGTLLTERGRVEAKRRTRFMERFLDQLAEELGVRRPGSGSDAKDAKSS